ncbi:MAG: hypothetical protein K0M63_08060 [Weeksellaceae bacterium]|nr:hypothetical protein [Weeksellaceae bacterium]
MSNRAKAIPITILCTFFIILSGCSQENKTITEDDEKIIMNAKEIVENKYLTDLIAQLENTELTEEKDINKIPMVVSNFLNALLEDKPIANPNENWIPTDVILDKKLPRRKLQYFGSGKNIALMNYFKGGIGKSTIILIFEFNDKKVTKFWCGSVLVDLNNKDTTLKYLKENINKEWGLNTNILSY